VPPLEALPTPGEEVCWLFSNIAVRIRGCVTTRAVYQSWARAARRRRRGKARVQRPPAAVPPASRRSSGQRSGRRRSSQSSGAAARAAGARLARRVPSPGRLEAAGRQYSLELCEPCAPRRARRAPARLPVGGGAIWPIVQPLRRRKRLAGSAVYAAEGQFWGAVPIPGGCRRRPPFERGRLRAGGWLALCRTVKDQSTASRERSQGT